MVRSFGDPQPEPTFEPDPGAAGLEIPARIVVDRASLEHLGVTIATVVAAAVQDGIEQGLQEARAAGLLPGVSEASPSAD